MLFSSWICMSIWNKRFFFSTPYSHHEYALVIEIKDFSLAYHILVMNIHELFEIKDFSLAYAIIVMNMHEYLK